MSISINVAVFVFAVLVVFAVFVALDLGFVIIIMTKIVGLVVVGGDLVTLIINFNENHDRHAMMMVMKVALSLHSQTAVWN